MVWVLAFLVLLRADLVGVWLAVLLTALNLVESQVFLILLPGERWILVTTVLARTLLLLAIAVEFAGQIWPQAGHWLRQLSVGGGAAVTVGLLVVLGVGAPQAAHAYQQRRLAEHPCRATLEQLQAEAGGLTRTLLMADSALWRELYPWLQGHYRVAVVDGYTPDDRPFEEIQAEKLEAEARRGEFWWVELTPPGEEAPQWAPAAQRLFAEPDVSAVDVQQPDRCVRARVFRLPVGPDRTAQRRVGGCPGWGNSASGLILADSAGAVQQLHGLHPPFCAGRPEGGTTGQPARPGIGAHQHLGGGEAGA